MKAAQPTPENPKIKLKFGGPRQDQTIGRHGSLDATPGPQVNPGSSAQSSAVEKILQPAADQLARAKSNGTPSGNRESSDSVPPGQLSRTNGLKEELSHSHSPALDAVRSNGFSGPSLSEISRVSNDPIPPTGNTNYPVTDGVLQPSQLPAAAFNSRLRQNGKTAADALITGLNIQTHPELENAPRISLNMHASSKLTQQSTIMHFTRQQWRLLVSPTLSSTITQRPSKTIVTCSGRRIASLPQNEIDHTHPVYECKLTPGTNTIEVEVVAGPPRGAPKVGTGQEVEMEKFTVYAYCR